MVTASKETEEKILLAAFSVFLKKGKAGSRMQEIADKAGVNKSLLHYYFRSKDRLYLAVLKHTVEKYILTIIQDLDLSAGIKEIIKKLIYSQINTIQENKQIFQFFMGEVWMNPDEVKNIFRETLKILDKSAFVVLMEKINYAAISKEIREVSPFQLLVNIFSLDIFFAILSPILFELTDFSEEVRVSLVESRADEVFDFVWESIRLRK